MVSRDTGGFSDIVMLGYVALKSNINGLSESFTNDYINDTSDNADLCNYIHEVMVTNTVTAGMTILTLMALVTV